jgi:hypothetical protein
LLQVIHPLAEQTERVVERFERRHARKKVLGEAGIVPLFAAQAHDEQPCAPLAGEVAPHEARPADLPGRDRVTDDAGQHAHVPRRGDALAVAFERSLEPVCGIDFVLELVADHLDIDVGIAMLEQRQRGCVAGAGRFFSFGAKPPELRHGHAKVPLRVATAVDLGDQEAVA